MTRLIEKLSNLISRKPKNNTYYWAGPGKNPLIHLGIKNWKKNRL